MKYYSTLLISPLITQLFQTVAHLFTKTSPTIQNMLSISIIMY